MKLVAFAYRAKNGDVEIDTISSKHESVILNALVLVNDDFISSGLSDQALRDRFDEVMADKGEIVLVNIEVAGELSA